ncbi:MAG: hypothetical protein AB8G05_16880, partial [Oligoflexales bacterium]
AWAPPRSFDFPTIISFLEKLGKFAKDYSALSLTHKSGGVFPIRHYLTKFIDARHKPNAIYVKGGNLLTIGYTRKHALKSLQSCRTDIKINYIRNFERNKKYNDGDIILIPCTEELRIAFESDRFALYKEHKDRYLENKITSDLIRYWIGRN